MVVGWSDWRTLDLAAQYSGPAVYKIRLSHNSQPASIPRFLGVDPTGILCIGKTTNMENRRIQFMGGIQKGRGHFEANLLHLLRQHSPLMTKFPNHHYDYMFVRIQLQQLGEESVVEEAEIKAYVRTFGEVPPLNSAIPDRYGVWHIDE